MRRYCLTLALLIPLTSGAADLPSAATPGGVQPNLGDGITEPFVYPNTVPSSGDTATDVTIDDGAPRMLVKGFRIQGVVPRPEIGITQQAVEQVVQTAAQSLVARGAASGFTVSMFEVLTRAVSVFYRERGFFLARAYIPEQRVADGIVTISIIEGFLDQVVYPNNQLYSDQQLDDVFDRLVGKSVYLPAIEQAIFITNDFPGLDANVLFGPGLKPGSAAIQVNTREDPYSGFVSWDNYGSFYTGEDRLRGNFKANNLFGKADQIEANGIMMLNPQNGFYFDVAYEQPILDYNFIVGGGYSQNSFDVGGNLADLNINGESTILNGFMRYIFRRGRDERITATLDLSLKTAESRVVSTLDSRDKLTVLSGQALYEGSSWSDGSAYQQLGATLSLGLPGFLGSMDTDGDGLSGRTGGSDKTAGGDFTKLNIDYLRVQKLSSLQNLIFRFSWQSSSDLLTSLEQFSLGGPDTVRAYPVADALMDNVRFFSAEWRIIASPDIPYDFFNGLQLFAFYDNAEGNLNDPLNNDIDKVSLSGYGFGAEFEPYKAVKTKIQMAFDLGDEPSDNQSLPFYLSLQYDF